MVDRFNCMALPLSMYHANKRQTPEHYQRLVKIRTENWKRSFVQRFWSRVQKTDGCWIWTAAHKPEGYGKMWMNGKLESAHRISWILTRGPIPDGLWVLHKCDNPPCVNPDHLYIGYRKENGRDAAERHRIPYGKDAYFSKCVGEKNFNARCTDQIVRDIRAKYVPRKFGLWRLSKFFGLPRTTIGNIVNRRTWKHVQ